MEQEFNLIFDKEIFDILIQTEFPLAQKYLWIATANIKNILVPAGRKYKSILYLFDQLLSEGINIRLLSASDPSQSFDSEMDSHPATRSDNFELQICPRNHAKIVIIDGKIAYMGSANLTGAGMGAKSIDKRNFEAGIISQDNKIVNKLADYFDKIWMGAWCAKCQLKNICPSPID